MSIGHIDDFQTRVTTTDVTIPAASSLSNGERLGGSSLVGLIMPASWDAADITFEVSTDVGGYVPLYDSFGGVYTVTVGTSRWVLLPPADLAGPYYVRIRSGTPDVPVNQTAERVITLVGRAFS